MLPLIYDCLLREEKAVINQQGKGFGSFWRCLFKVDEFGLLAFGSTAEFFATEEKWDKFVFREF